jgi:ribosomal protein S28E/S33
MLSSNKLNILILGGSGNLGRLITMEALSSSKFNVTVLMRNPEKHKDFVSQIESMGGRVIVGDVKKPETIKDITKGMHTVISALIGDDECVVEGQNRILQDGVKNGLKRFVPSDFSFDIWKIPEDYHYFISQRLRFRKMLEKTNVKGLHFSNGMFMQTFFWMINKYGLQYWGDINQKLDLTSEEDVARFVVRAVSDPNRTGDVKIVGNELSMKEIVEIYNLVMKKNETAKNMGSIEDLKKYVMDLKSKGNVFDSIQMGYSLPMFDGTGKIKKPMNSEFKDITTTRFEDFLKKFSTGKFDYNYTIPDICKSVEKQILAK